MPEEATATNSSCSCRRRSAATPRAQLADDLIRWSGSVDPALMVVGDSAEVAAAIEPFYAAGATSVILQPREEETDLAGYMAGVGEVARLIGD